MMAKTDGEVDHVLKIKMAFMTVLVVGYKNQIFNLYTVDI